MYEIFAAAREGKGRYSLRLTFGSVHILSSVSWLNPFESILSAGPCVTIWKNNQKIFFFCFADFCDPRHALFSQRRKLSARSREWGGVSRRWTGWVPTLRCRGCTEGHHGGARVAQSSMSRGSGARSWAADAPC